MSKLKTKFLEANYFSHLFKRDWKEERFIYLLIEKDYRTTGYGGWLDTSEGVHRYHEFTTKEELAEYLEQSIAPRDRSDWVAYKRIKSLERV